MGRVWEPNRKLEVQSVRNAVEACAEVGIRKVGRGPGQDRVLEAKSGHHFKEGHMDIGVESRGQGK